MTEKEISKQTKESEKKRKKKHLQDHIPLHKTIKEISRGHPFILP
jgi:hypothetical protein